jgi:hypothetical protein
LAFASTVVKEQEQIKISLVVEEGVVAAVVVEVEVVKVELEQVLELLVIKGQQGLAMVALFPFGI